MGRLNPKKPPILAVDFDGTITNSTDLREFDIDSPPKKHCKEVLDRLHRRGCVIILWTCRQGAFLKEAINYCRKHELPIYLFNENAPTIPWDCRKIYADYYIDDLSFDKDTGAIDWLEVERQIMRDDYFAECQRCGDAECINCPRGEI